MPPDLLLALLARDKRAPASALAVLVLLVAESMVSAEWQRIKQVAVASMTGRSQTSVSDALRWLVAQGYLECTREPFVGLLYRVPHTRGQ